ncbi:uncharacterized protein LOC123539144 isoform X2 [Mercenaria mercenaria]|uniref:uncharacterized protein LOC123539144 isoform X2 n=1 Tax=Mercenaria mercenaria TaxID=6596 RepID=UPI00234E832E|nr:uncharacterized protein LOC123539144 isoform X2 [Mercenaria mercenaria]
MACLSSCWISVHRFCSSLFQRLRSFALRLGQSQGEGGTCTEVTEAMRALPPGSDEVVALAVTEELSTEAARKSIIMQLTEFCYEAGKGHQTTVDKILL